MILRQPMTVAASTVLLLVAFAVPYATASSFPLGASANYAILFEGAGGNSLQITNVTVNGNVGVGMTGTATDSGPSSINGSLDFSAPNTGQFSNNNAANTITGGVNYNVAAVASGLNTVNSLNTTLGSEAGTSVNIGTGTGKTLTIDASAGVLDAFGNRVFTVTGFNTTNGDVLRINGDLAGDNVVLNFVGLSANFNNQVILNGISADQVLYNFVGGSNLVGGPTLQINNNASSHLGAVYGIFLNPNGAISVTNALVNGRVFGGDTHNFQYVSGSTINAPQVPEPSSLFLLLVGSAVGWAALRRREKCRAY